MVIDSKTKRLEKIDIHLTPKQRAIYMVDQMLASDKDWNEFIKWKATFLPFSAFKKLAEEKHPGKSPMDAAARSQMAAELYLEFDTLREAVFHINEDIFNRLEVAAVEAALRISTLQALIIQDAFGRTARKAAGWIETIETKEPIEEENRQIMLKELEAYDEVDLSPTMSDIIPLPGATLRFPSAIERYLEDAVGLIENVFSYAAAVKIIEDKYFDSHKILMGWNQSKLSNIESAIKHYVETFNSYLEVRKTLFSAEWEEEEESGDPLVSAIPGEREGTLKIDLDIIRHKAAIGAKMKATNWMSEAKDRAVMEFKADIQGNYYEAAKEYAVKKKWIKP